MAPGTVFAGHRIEALVGRGGMGVVYRARQLDLGRVVALKVIAPDLLEDAEMRARFVGEAQTAASIEHPHVIPLHYVGEEDGVAFLAMRFIEGPDVRQLVHLTGALAPARAAEMAAQAAGALDAIHAAGLVHRDIKPANLLVADGDHIYVSDFGLAKHVLARAGPTSSGRWVGTLDYVAPEQIRGGRIDARTDVYALGAVLYFMLTAHVPFEREGDEARLWAQLTEAPPRPSASAPGIPTQLDSVVERALAKQRDDRYPSAGDLGRAARAATGASVTPQPERVVARGAAAPEGASREPGLAAEMATLSAGAPAPTLRAPRQRGMRSRIAWLVAAALAAAAGAAIVLAAPWDGGGRRAPDGAASRSGPTPAPSPTPAATGPRKGAVIPDVGRRPNGIAVAGGDVWVSSYALPSLTRIDAASGRERAVHPRAGAGPLRLASRAGSLWEAAYDSGEVLRLDPRSGRVRRRIATALPPAALALGDRDLWIVGDVTGDADALLHYDSGGRLIRRLAVPDGVSAIVLARGALFASTRRAARLLRIDPRTGAMQNWGELQEPAISLAYGAGYVWASLRAADIVVRVHPRSGETVTTATPRQPEQLVVADGHVYVACSADHVVVALDPATMRPWGRAVPIQFNPYALAAGEGHVWVTDLGANTVTRVDY
jgi:sugar lactone lactonase YvrE